MASRSCESPPAGIELACIAPSFPTLLLLDPSLSFAPLHSCRPSCRADPCPNPLVLPLPCPAGMTRRPTPGLQTPRCCSSLAARWKPTSSSGLWAPLPTPPGESKRAFKGPAFLARAEQFVPDGCGEGGSQGQGALMVTLLPLMLMPQAQGDRAGFVAGRLWPRQGQEGLCTPSPP